MIKHMGRMLIIISILSLLTGTAFGTELTQRFNAKEGFLIKLPYNWVEIPSKVLDERSKMLRNAALDAERPVYDYGFQLSGAEQWLTYPYILIYVNDSGRIPEGKMKKYNKIESRAGQETSPVKERISGIPDTQVGEISYDSNDHILWMTFTASVKDAGIIKGLIATRLTRKGCIQIICYAEDKAFSDYRKLFEDIVMSIHIDKKLEYKSRITDSIPIISHVDLDKLLSRVFTSALLIAAIWLLLSRIKKKG